MRKFSSVPYVIIGFAVAAALLLAAELYRAREAPARPMLPVSFDHADHRETPCADCHHNFTDGSGGGTCYLCHKYSPEIAADMEKMFHDYCFSCHAEMAMRGEDTGPPRQCAVCHAQ